VGLLLEVVIILGWFHFYDERNDPVRTFSVNFSPIPIARTTQDLLPYVYGFFPKELTPSSNFIRASV